jgi:hypothetical protein
MQYVDTLEQRRALGKMTTNATPRSRVMGAGVTSQSKRVSLVNGVTVSKDLVPASVDFATEQLQEQLEAYDKRLNVLRNQLRSSVDERLKMSDVDPAKQERKGAGQDVIVQGLVTATGQGCKEVIQGSAKAKKGTKSGHVWKTRPFKSDSVKSSCTLKLDAKKCTNVTIRITFAEGDSVPEVLLFEHAPKAAAAFKPLGKISLQKKSLKQLKHVFHLGNVPVDRYLRVGCMGLIGDNKSRFHAVSYLLVTGEAIGSDEESETVCENLEESQVKDDVVEFRVSMEEEMPKQSVQGDTSAVRKGKESSTPDVWQRLSAQKNDAQSQRKSVATRASQYVLSTDRRQFVERVLDEFNISGTEAAEMVKNIVFGNDASLISSLDQNQVDKLVACLPTKDERRRLRTIEHYGGSSDAEQFMVDLLSIDNLASKVETRWFLADFDARAVVIQDAANLISRACGELQKCTKLQLAIKVILNECSESLDGAKVLDVSLLKELKHAPYNVKGSLLHFVAAKMSEASGSMKVPNISKDLPSCSMASQVSLSEIKCEVKQLADGIDEANLAWRADEPGAALIERKVDSALTKLGSTEAIATETEADLLECAMNVGLDPSSVNDSDEFFRAILDFSDELNTAHLENKSVGFLTRSQEAAKTPLKTTVHLAVNERESMQRPACAPTPTSRISVEHLVQPTQKPSAVEGVEGQHDEHNSIPENGVVSLQEESEEQEAASDELSTPVRKLLQSSRALIDSIDFKTLDATPIKFIQSEMVLSESMEDDDQICEISSPPQQKAPSAVESSWHKEDVADVCASVDECVAEREPSFEDVVVKIDHSVDVKYHGDETHLASKPSEVQEEIENAESEIVPEDDALPQDKEDDPVPSHQKDIVQTKESVQVVKNDEASQKADDLASVLDLDLAAKLLHNAEKVKKSRSSSMKADEEINDDDAKSVASKEVKDRRLVSVAKSLKSEHEQSLTPEQAKAVKALGEVIRRSLPKFSATEADKRSGLRIEGANLDLDTILSTIIMNAGNTPTGPLARGVRGGNQHLFDGKEAAELRRQEKQKYHDARRLDDRKALLEPIIPAPLGMGVSVSKTVSEGISPQTLARSLQSSMRATSSRSGSKSGRDSVHQKSNMPSVAAPNQTAFKVSVKDSVKWKDEPFQSLKSSQNYSKAPTWKEDASGEGSKVHDKPVFMAQPQPLPLQHSQHMPSMILEEDIDALPSPQQHVIHEQDDRCDLDSLGPTGLRLSRDDALKSSREHASLAAQRMQMWGYSMN